VRAARRLLLARTGPLPQYHPNFLAALLLAGKRTVAAAVFQRLAMWLTALQQQAMASLADAGQQPPSPSPGTHVAGLEAADANRSGTGVPLPMFAGGWAAHGTHTVASMVCNGICVTCNAN